MSDSKNQAMVDAYVMHRLQQTLNNNLNCCHTQEDPNVSDSTQQPPSAPPPPVTETAAATAAKPRDEEEDDDEDDD